MSVFIGELSPLMLKDIKEKCLLFPVIFVASSEIIFVWLFLRVCCKITFLLFLGCSFSPRVGIFHLVPFVDLDLWNDTV